MQLISLLVIAITAILAWRTGKKWCCRCAVVDPVSSATLAFILPTAGIVAATHFVALITLATDTGIVSTPAIAIFFVLITMATSAAIDRFIHDESLPPIAETRTTVDRSWLGRWVWVAAIVVALYTLFLLDALTRYPTGVDGLHYHLPIAVEWMRTGRMDLVVGLRLQSLPENGMIIPALLLAAKLESLVNVAALPYGLLIGTAIYALARQIGASAKTSAVSACVALSVPIVLFQSFSSYIDMYAASAWLCSVLAIVWATRAPTSNARWGLIALAGLSAGVALGSKTTFLVLVFFLAVVIVRAEWFRIPGQAPRKPRPIFAVALFSVACLPCSIYWFARGTVQANNPVYPLAVEVAGHEILPGFNADSMPCFEKRPIAEKLERWLPYPWREQKYSGTGYPYSVNNAFGAPYAMLVPLSILAVATGFLRQERRSWRDRWIVTYAILALIGVVALLTFFRENLRFVLPCVLIATSLTALLLDRLCKVFPRALPALVTIAFATTATIAGFKPAHAIAGRIKDNVWTRADFYEIPAMIDDLPPGSRILNLASPYATYPLLGKRLDLDVISPNHWAIETDRNTTADALYEHKIDYVYYRPVYTNSWREDLPLELLYDDTQEANPLPDPPRRLFRVIPPNKPIASSRNPHRSSLEG